MQLSGVTARVMTAVV